MNPEIDYEQQSRFTDPGQFQSLFSELPEAPLELSELTRGLMLHHLDIASQHKLIPLGRLAELDLRYVARMIEKILKLNNTPLSQPRSLQTKLIGSCRDFSLLFCSMLRHKKIPARLRYGFSTFHIPGFHHDQVLLEYWDKNKKSWCLTDARMDSEFIEKYKLPSDFCPHDIPYTAFFTAAEAWNLCRAGTKNAQQFGTGIKKRVAGWWYIRNKLIQDLAALNKMELLSWDCWGFMLSGESDDFMQDANQVALMDSIAALLSLPQLDLPKLKSIYDVNEGLRMSGRIYSYSYFSGAREVELF